MCVFLHVSRTAYYRWLKHPHSQRELDNEKLAKIIRKIHDKHPDMGYRRIRDELDRNYDQDVNDKRVLRICRYEHIRSTIDNQPKSLTKRANQPFYSAKNILNRKFYAEAPNTKWCTDISEFAYYQGKTKHRVYLSAIIDLYDRRIVSYKISDYNDLQLVMDTLEQAVKANPGVHPLFHSDRGTQYTSKQFHTRLTELGMTQSMSRVGKCIDNGPIEGFWGTIKREKYYRRSFNERDEVTEMIDNYIDYYNNGRFQRTLNVLTPIEYHNHFYEAA